MNMNLRRILPCLVLTAFCFAVPLPGHSQGGSNALGLAGADKDEKNRELLATVEESLRTQLVQIKKTETDQENLASAEEIQTLLDMPRVAIVSSEELKGNWQVRSLQTGQFGAYRYPFFKCRIYAEGKAFYFHKATGSQRRMGTLVREDEKKYLFTGASYYEGDPVGKYISAQDNPTEEQTRRNSVGHLYKLGKSHYLMIFLKQGVNGEVYELKK
jgi:hypothetical protein